MIAVDTLARSAARIEIPLVILSALINGPDFVAVVTRDRRRQT